MENHLKAPRWYNEISFGLPEAKDFAYGQIYRKIDIIAWIEAKLLGRPDQGNIRKH